MKFSLFYLRDSPLISPRKYRWYCHNHPLCTVREGVRFSQRVCAAGSHCFCSEMKSQLIATNMLCMYCYHPSHLECLIKLISEDTSVIQATEPKRRQPETMKVHRFGVCLGCHVYFINPEIGHVRLCGGMHIQPNEMKLHLRQHRI